MEKTLLALITLLAISGVALLNNETIASSTEDIAMLKQYQAWKTVIKTLKNKDIF